jgi:transcription antitermination factor NusG
MARTKATIGRLGELVKDYDWYALLVPPQKEFVAQEILKRQGVVTFCPFDSMWRFRSRYSKTKELKNYPMMPRYVFAGFKPGRVPPWYDIFALQIVKGVVALNGSPVKIHGVPDLIQRFRNGLKRPEEERYMQTHKEYQVGDMVVIIDPRFQDRLVQVESIEGGMAFFKIELFNGVHRLSLPADMLVAA